MKKNIFRRLILIIVFFIPINVFAGDLNYKEYEVSVIINSLDENIPRWLLIERGKKAYQLGELGLSTRIFREVLKRYRICPDADIWLARIFFQEGEYPLSEKQYLKALENKDQLYVLDDEFTINKELINLYELTDQYGKFEDTIIKMLEKNETYENILKLQYQMINLLDNQGIDKLFELYRYQNIKLNLFRLKLGEFYYRTGRYSEAEINLILPIVSVASKGYDFLYNKDVDYSYNTFSQHIDSMYKYGQLIEFVNDNNFFENIYYLAAAFYANGKEKSANELWNLVVEFDQTDSTWFKRSNRQLDNPFIEPIITYSGFDLY